MINETSNRRRAAIYLPLEAVRDMLALPDGLTVDAIAPDFLCDAIVVRVTGDQLAEVSPGVCLPILATRWEMHDQGAQVAALHFPIHLTDVGPVCATCSGDDDRGELVHLAWPCPTWQIVSKAGPVTRNLRVIVEPDPWTRPLPAADMAAQASGETL